MCVCERERERESECVGVRSSVDDKTYRGVNGKKLKVGSVPKNI